MAAFEILTRIEMLYDDEELKRLEDDYKKAKGKLVSYLWGKEGLRLVSNKETAPETQRQAQFKGIHEMSEGRKNHHGKRGRARRQKKEVNRMTEDTRNFREEWEADRLRREEAARRILEVSAELHLTWREFEQILDQVKGIAYLTSGSEPVRTS